MLVRLYKENLFIIKDFRKIKKGWKWLWNILSKNILVLGGQPLLATVGRPKVKSIKNDGFKKRIFFRENRQFCVGAEPNKPIFMIRVQGGVHPYGLNPGSKHFCSCSITRYILFELLKGCVLSVFVCALSSRIQSMANPKFIHSWEGLFVLVCNVKKPLSILV